MTNSRFDESNPNKVRFRIEGATAGYGGDGTQEINYLNNYSTITLSV